MIIFYSAFVSISKDVIEAATMDGCNVLQQYRYIKFPLIKNIFSIVIVMLVNGCLKTFDVFYILDNKSRSTEMVATYMYKTAFNSADFGYGSTLSVFLVWNVWRPWRSSKNVWELQRGMRSNDKIQKKYNIAGSLLCGHPDLCGDPDLSDLLGHLLKP